MIWWEAEAKASLVKGRWLPEGQTEGLCRYISRFRIGLRQIRCCFLHNPPVSPIGEPAPFHKGAILTPSH